MDLKHGRLPSSEENRLDVFDNQCFRRILGIKWFHCVRNTTVRERTGQTPVSMLFRTRRFKMVWPCQPDGSLRKDFPKPYHNGGLRMQNEEGGGAALGGEML